ncbi:ATP-binding protein [Actinomadura parmotrematis]|uniref:ATP-binding protein n=1 Tax=Actinomadura parmotrematis TaxID=2864039 RepID=A0ABS7G1X5_9ACTN|nr:ATP-binding protein [Actinomadura parmotrematis]MBW8486711.1 ATP-binding protein [Actinomadura parmotrematis]
MRVWTGSDVAVVGHSAVVGGEPLVRRARRWLRDVVERAAPWVEIGDVDLLASEVLTNAVRHTASREPGRSVVVAVAWEAGVVRVSVTDEGWAKSRPQVRTASEVAEMGRGLALLDALAAGWGHEVGPGLGCPVTVWFEMKEVRA